MHGRWRALAAAVAAAAGLVRASIRAGYYDRWYVKAAIKDDQPLEEGVTACIQAVSEMRKAVLMLMVRALRRSEATSYMTLAVEVGRRTMLLAGQAHETGARIRLHSFSCEYRCFVFESHVGCASERRKRDRPRSAVQIQRLAGMVGSPLPR